MDAHHHDGPLDGGDVVVLAGAPVASMWISTFRVISGSPSTRAATVRPLMSSSVLTHGLQLPHGVLEHGQGLLVEEGDVAVEAVEGLGDQGHLVLRGR